MNGTMDRKKNLQNLMLVNEPVLVGRYGIPLLKNETFVPETIIPFSDIRTAKSKECGVHFFIDDYRFERIWSHPCKYLNLVRQFSCIFAPDFSLYMDMPVAMKIWNVYRNRLIGLWMQNNGIRVIPTVAWAEPASYEYCFDGIEPYGTVAVSTVGSKRNGYSMEMWKRGIREMIARLSPSSVLIYGEHINYNFADTKVVYYQDSILNRLHRVKK